MPVPRQLPATTRHLAGRDEALRRLEEFLPESGCGHGGGIVLITGGAGVGKTTLAVHWAQRVADRFPDGVLFLDLHGFDLAGEVVEPNSALRRLLEGLGVPAGPRPLRSGGAARTRLAAYAARQPPHSCWCARQRVPDANQVRPLLPGLGASLALVTSRNQLAGLADHAQRGGDPIERPLVGRSGAEGRAADLDVGQQRLADPASFNTTSNTTTHR